ncbi:MULTISPECIES: putative holin-like toxin [Paenibacillus]
MYEALTLMLSFGTFVILMLSFHKKK